MLIADLQDKLKNYDTKTRGYPHSNAKFRQASVLLPIMEYKDEPTLFMNQRSLELTYHAGQICFPGGRAEEKDADEIATALRETEEEIGIAQNYIDVMGKLDRYFTVTGFEITPVVGRIRTGYDLNPDRGEVGKMFHLPLSTALDPKQFVVEQMTVGGEVYHYPVLQFNDYKIWGATAGILVNLMELYDRAQEIEDIHLCK